MAFANWQLISTSDTTLFGSWWLPIFVHCFLLLLVSSVWSSVGQVVHLVIKPILLYLSTHPNIQTINWHNIPLPQPSYFCLTEKTCSTLLPRHGATQPKEAQDSPYTLEQTVSTYNPGDQVKGLMFIYFFISRANQ